MLRRDVYYRILTVIILLSLAIKLIMIFKYGNMLNLGSDDLNYVKSAVALLKNGILTYHNYNEPTVFIMPLYPMFLAMVFKVFGYGFAGLQAVRVIQALISCITIVYIFLMASDLFDKKAGIISAFLMAFYLPNITTSGYFLTETVFTALLCALIHYSLKVSKKPVLYKFMLLGVLWAAATLCRPTILFYPLFFFLYLFLYHRISLNKILKWSMSMMAVFALIMSPWWLRNYREYGVFIPLAASSGNPMLQGTYIDYVQNPDNIVHYEMGKNAFETNKNEMKAVKQRIRMELEKDFWGYLRWYTLGKTLKLWSVPFYWKRVFDIGIEHVFPFHCIILSGFIGIAILIFKGAYEFMKGGAGRKLAGNEFFRYFIPVSVILYFNLIHCVYMAFDRYAFPLMPLVSIFTGYLAVKVSTVLKSLVKL